MARLRGNKTKLDLTVPFSIKSGGAIYDLSKDLHFEIVKNNDDIIERFSESQLDSTDHTFGTFLNGMPSLQINGLIKDFAGFNPMISYANDEFTVSFWVRFVDTLGDQFFLLSRKPSTDQTQTKFFSRLVRTSDTQKLRIFFGINSSVLFCDSYDNERLINDKKSSALTPSDYASADADSTKLTFGEWHHFVIRNKLRTNISQGVCDLYIDGKLRSRYISPYSVGIAEKQPSYIPPGAGALNSEDLKNSYKIYGKILTPLASYSNIICNSEDVLSIAYNEYFQIAKWNRILTEKEIEALYQGTLNDVYVTRTTSYSAPPRSLHDDRDNKLVYDNYGFFDFTNKTKEVFQDRLVGNNSIAYLGSNRLSNDEQQHLEISSNIRSNIIERNLDNNEKNKTQGFFENYEQKMFKCVDGSIAKSIVKIDVSSVDRIDNLQYAGRTDSKFALTVANYQNMSMFLSSALKLAPPSIVFSYDVDFGIAGTGFLYYSPTRKCWIEKRSDFSTSKGINTENDDKLGATNAIEINHFSSVQPQSKGWPTTFLNYDFGTYDDVTNYSNITRSDDPNLERMNIHFNLLNAVGTPGTLAPLRDYVYYSSKLQVTGADKILRQFTASPQMGYFFNSEEHLKDCGYENIGSPTVAFGAPFENRYHGFDDETIKLKNYIDGPFKLKKAILRIPVEIRRYNEKNLHSGYEPIAYYNFDEAAIDGDIIHDKSSNDIDAIVENTYVDLTSTPCDSEGITRGSLRLQNNRFLPPPSISPTSWTTDGESNATLDITIQNSISNSTTYYTTNGSNPTNSDQVYTNEFTISDTTTIKALTIKNSRISTVAEKNYEKPQTVATPEILVSSDPWTTNGQTNREVEVNIICATQNSIIEYSYDNFATTHSYSSPITIDESLTIYARAKKSNYFNSLETNKILTKPNVVSNPVITINPYDQQNQNNFSTDDTYVTITTQTQDATIYYTVDGSTPTTSSNVYTSSFVIGETTTVKAIAIKSNCYDSQVIAQTFTSPIQSPVISPDIWTTDGTSNQTIQVSISTTESDASIQYTVGDPAFMNPSAYVEPFTISSTATIYAKTIKTGYADSYVISKTLTKPSVVSTPNLNPNSTTFAVQMLFSITTVTANATIKYTMNGSDPLLNGTIYDGNPVLINTTSDVRAIAIKSGLFNSAEGNEVYTLAGVSPGGGSGGSGTGGSGIGSGGIGTLG